MKYAAPSRALQAGEILKPDNLELVDWPVAHPLVGAFLNPADLVGRAVLYPIDKDQPIIDKVVSVAGAGTGLSGRIPDGMRAIALRSDEVMGVAGFLLPGSHLDVLVTLRSEKASEPSTSIVLQDAEVLAAGHQIEPDPEGKPATVTVVTLLLTPVDAERAVLASTQGTIHFVLRSGSDKVKIQSPPILLSQLSGDTPVPAATNRHSDSPPVVHHATQAPVTIQTFTGDKQVTDTVGGTGK
jgi:pilus assembly protein CpaB